MFEQLTKREYYLHNNILIFVKNFPPLSVDIEKVVLALEKLIPENLCIGIDGIIIGDFPDLEVNKLDSFSQDGNIYIKNNIVSSRDLLKLLVIEIGYNIFRTSRLSICKSGKIEKEFVDKRLRFFRRVEKYLNKQIIPVNLFVETEYNKKLSRFITDVIGSSKLSKIIKGLYVGTSSVLSITEYFVSGFTFFTLGDYITDLKTQCPFLYKELLILFKEDTDEKDIISQSGSDRNNSCN